MVGEQIKVGEDVLITLVKIGGRKVRIGIEAPGYRIVRAELGDDENETPESPPPSNGSPSVCGGERPHSVTNANAVRQIASSDTMGEE